MMELPLLIGASVVLTTGGLGLMAWNGRAETSSEEFFERFERLVRGKRPKPQQRRNLRSILIDLGKAQSVRRGIDDEVPLLLARAGFRGRDTLALFAATRTLAPLIAVVSVVGLWLVFGGHFGVGLLVGIYGLFTVSYLAPKWLLRGRARSREQRIRDDTALLTHLLRVLYDCGLSTEQALQIFAKDRSAVLPDVAIEVAEVMRMVSAGSDLGDATRDVADDLAISELTDLFAMIRQIDRYGGQVQEPLLRFAQLLEDRERTRLQENISKLSAKLTVVMVLFLLPALLAFVAGPGFTAVIRALGEMNG